MIYAERLLRGSAKIFVECRVQAEQDGYKSVHLEGASDGRFLFSELMSPFMRFDRCRQALHYTLNHLSLIQVSQCLPLLRRRHYYYHIKHASILLAIGAAACQRLSRYWSNILSCIGQ